MSSKLHKIVDTNKRCKHIKREGESCTLNNNCTYPDCKIETFNTKREMKTPMQELLDYTTDLLHTFDSEQRVAMTVLDYLKTNKRAMLEKEKEVIIEAWLDDRFPLDKQWAKQCAEAYYNETFKTKEK